MEATDKEVQAGAAIYSRFFLHFYDWQALKINCRFAWKCPSKKMLALYNENVSSNHLDIGPGTGYFLKNCRFPVSSPRIALMDLNTNCLSSAVKGLKKYKPEVYQGNVLEPLEIEAESFDSVAVMNVLHCLPGNMKNKAVVFENLKQVLNPGGVLFGSTILGKGTSYNFFARYLLSYCNKKGYMTNYEDDYELLEKALDDNFDEFSLRQVGSVALFSARKEE